MKVYVGTYKKYANGSINGAWIDLDDHLCKDDFLDACRELHGEEDDPEFMFQDWEGIPSGLISESHISPECWDVLEAYDEFSEDAVNAYCYLFGEWDKDKFQACYHGEFESWGVMAEEWLDSTGELNETPASPRSYFDYQPYARDMRLSGEMSEHDDHFFWNA